MSRKKKLVKIAKGAGIAIGGAVITYVAEVISQTDFGVVTPLITAGAGIAINAIRQWLRKEEERIEEQEVGCQE